MVQELLFFIKCLNLSLKFLTLASVSEYVKVLWSFANENENKDSNPSSKLLTFGLTQLYYFALYLLIYPLVLCQMLEV